MKLAVVVLAFVAAVAAAPAAPAEDAAAEVLRSNFDQQPEGGYQLDFETSNGIKRQETGEVKEVPNEENKPQAVVVVRGSYAYNDVEGKPVSITYFADETGYHAEGDSIPKPQ